MKINDFKIPLKHLAELMWAGDCTSYESNRRGVNFYSCASHGGWVVDSRHLTSEEREKVDKYIVPQYFHVAVQKRPYRETDYDEPGDKETIIGTSAVEFYDEQPRAKRSISYNSRDGPVEWKKLPVYVFEEDSDWVVLEHETSVRLQDTRMNPEERQRMINDAWERYTKHR